MRMRALLTTLAAFAAVVALTAVPAGAKVPGPNGRVLYGVVDPNLGDTVIYTANPDGSQVKQLIPGAPEPSECPRWSPDGTEIATCGTPSGGAARIIDPDTGSYRDLPNPDPADAFIFACAPWSPDGKRLLCETFWNDPSLNGIYTIRSSDGGGLTRLTSNPNGDDVPGDYSPDGKQLVFLRHDPTRPAGTNRAGANQALFVLNLDSGALRRITPWGLPHDAGSWSPDGTKILFSGGGLPSTGGDQLFNSLYVVHPDGSGLAKIPLTGTHSSSSASEPGWSPDGTKIIFKLATATSRGTSDEEIYTAKADGSDLQHVTRDANDVDWTDWGPHALVP
jgi:TolB protein